MADQRLPVVDGDDGAWGDILNEYLGKEHYNGDGNFVPGTSTNGSHQRLTVRPGTAAAGTAPLKFSSGTLLTTPEAGVVEFNSNRLHFTQTTGPTRLTVAAYNDASGATGDTYYRDASGNFIRLPVGGTNTVLRVAAGLPSWQASGTAIAINLTVGTVAPGSPATGDLWVDTN